MSGTTIGGNKAKRKMIKREPGYYQRIGAKGGKNGHTGGFYKNSEAAREAGKRGGHQSRRLKEYPDYELIGLTDKYRILRHKETGKRKYRLRGNDELAL